MLNLGVHLEDADRYVRRQMEPIISSKQWIFQSAEIALKWIFSLVNYLST